MLSKRMLQTDCLEGNHRLSKYRCCPSRSFTHISDAWLFLDAYSLLTTIENAELAFEIEEIFFFIADNDGDIADTCVLQLPNLTFDENLTTYL